MRRQLFPRPLLVLLLAAVATGAWLRAQPARSAAGSPTSFPVSQAKATQETATLAAGCFWSMEAIFKQLKGVDKVEPGYAGGTVANPSYEQVSSGTTGHAESLNIIFDPKVITYRQLLQVLLTARNPTTVDQQGPDGGTEYRSVIFFRTAQQQLDAQAEIKAIDAKHIWPDPIVTKVEPFTHFYRAEDYHLNYYALHPDEPYCSEVIAPEIANFRREFKSWLK